jgi:hypothetical protein
MSTKCFFCVLGAHIKASSWVLLLGIGLKFDEDKKNRPAK